MTNEACNDATDASTDHEQTLDTNYEFYRDADLGGRIDGMLQTTFRLRSDDVKQSVGRFERAINQEWTLLYGVATSGAHGWQIAELDGDLRLAEGAYCGDVNWLVFENGWIHRMGGRWLKSEQVAEKVDEIQSRRVDLRDAQAEAEDEAFEAHDLIEYDRDLTGEPMEGWWRFKPTGYIGRPEAAVAYAEGYNARSDNGGE